MSNYLIKTTETYRCDTEQEAKDLIEQSKKSNQYSVTKHLSEVKTLKQKGEIVDEWRRVTITKEFSSEKEPYGDLMPIYSEPQPVHTKYQAAAANTLSDEEE